MAGKAKRFYLLDLLRGVASLAVVLWHWQHFYYDHPTALTVTLPTSFDRTAQPFYNALAIFYQQGWRAVPVFFALSGFVFFYQYGQAIRCGNVGGREFFVRRFARLYPLHISTLILVTIGQLVSLAIDGEFVVYPCNDVRHFVLNLSLTSHWLPVSAICWSFNEPVWSVSVEVFLYASFFAFALLLPQRWSHQVVASLLVVAIGVAVHRLGGFHLFGQPVFCFFAGGVTCLVWDRIEKEGSSAMKRSLGVSAGVLALSLAYLSVRGAKDVHMGIVTYPALIFCLAAVQSLSGDFGKGVRALGDISYSTYLLHFPLQLGIILLTKAGLVELDFNSRGVFVLFFTLLIVVSLAVHHLFEIPSRNYICRLLLGRGPPEGLPTTSRP